MHPRFQWATQQIGTVTERVWQLPGLRCIHLSGRFESADTASLPKVEHPTLCMTRRGEATLSSPKHPDLEPIAAHSGERTFREQTLNLLLPGNESLHWTMPNQELDLLLIEWTNKTLAEAISDLGTPWQRLEVESKRTEAIFLFPEAFPYGLAVHTAAHDLLTHLASTQPQAALHLRAGACSLLAHIADEAHLRTQPQPVHVRSDYDRERLHFARTYLLERMAMPPSLPDLARIAGINEFKLKRGFKELFGQPVFAYLAAARLEKARELLLSTTMTATEVAFELGYASLQHFSHAFKQRYGVTPTALRR